MGEEGTLQCSLLPGNSAEQTCENVSEVPCKHECLEHNTIIFSWEPAQ